MTSFILLLLSLDSDVDAITVVDKNVALRSCNTSWNDRASNWDQTTRSAVVQYCDQNTLVVFVFIFSLFVAVNQGASVGE